MRFLASIILAGSLLAGTAVAQTWPSGQVTIVVPQAPGNPSDLLARLVGSKLQDKWGQTVVVENKGGASGTIGTAQVARAAPDGNTFLFTFDVAITIAPNLIKLPYDSLTDLDLVAAFADTELMLIATPQLGVKTLSELIAKAKASPGKLTYASGGIGTPAHLCMELVRQSTGTDILHSPYRGASGAFQAMLSGEVDMFCGPPGGAIPLVESGKAVAIGTTGVKRAPQTAKVPTLQEAGIPDIEVTTKMLFMVPKGVPETILKRIRADLREVLDQADVRKSLATNSFNPIWLEGQSGMKDLAKDFAKWGVVIRAANIKAK